MMTKRWPLLLDRYLIIQLVPVCLFALALFTIIWLAPDILFKLTQYVFSGKIGIGQAFSMLLYHIPEVLQQTMPVATLLGSIFLFQRLSKDYEWISLLASGISPVRALGSVLTVGLLFAGLHLLVQEVILPKTTPQLEKMYMDLDLKDRPDRNFLFVEKNHHDRLSKFFMISRVLPNSLSDFIILYYEETPREGVHITRILRAKRGQWMPNVGQWQLQDGIEYVLNNEGVYKDIRQFDAQQIRTDRYAALLLDYTKMNPLVLPWNQLSLYIKLLREGGQLQDVPYFEVRLWQKTSAPFATLVFSVLGALLGIEHVRSRRIFGLTFGAIVVFIYSILTPFAGSFGSLDLAAPWLVAWIPLLVSIVVTLLLIRVRAENT
jgi:lipopolysaccharide export system permease protein